MTTLAEMKQEVARVNAEHGWYDEPRTFGELIALLHSEVSEALEAYRKWGLEDQTETQWVSIQGKKVLPKPEGVGSELADVFIRLLDMCSRHGIDLEYEYHRKVTYNKTRPYRHGGKKL
jgi:NTP pyrophosphatase (non-canonical NTP hydrolase)